jgi:DNA mismatch repair protein MutL
MVDVNVHPTKLEVRFHNSGALYSQLLATLRTKFLATDLTVRAQAAEEETNGEDDDKQEAQSRQQLIDWAKGQVASWPSRSEPDSAGYSAPRGSSPGGSRAPLELTRLDRPWTPPSGGANSGVEKTESCEPARSCEAPAEYRPARAMQVHNRYLVTETPDGVMLVDQHALHERILYEQLRGRISAGQIETQNLLVPEPVDLTPVEAAAALEHGELLAQLGMKVEPFGGDTVLIAGYPAMLANMDPADVLHALLDQLLSAEKTPDACDLLEELLHAIACKAAIKAGERLATEEIDALLQQRHLIDNAHHCPHGRPTAVIFTREELDKQFKRG